MALTDGSNNYEQEPNNPIKQKPWLVHKISMTIFLEMTAKETKLK